MIYIVNGIGHPPAGKTTFTLGDVPNLDFAVATTRHKFIRSAVVVQTKHVTGVTLQDFGGQSLSNSSNERSRVEFGGNTRTVSTVHIRIVVSSDAEARKTLSKDQAISDRPFECPVRFLVS